MRHGPKVRRACLALAASATGAVAQNEPLFTVAPGGPSGLRADIVYRTIGGVPTPVGGGTGMGLGRAGDNLQGLSPVSIAALLASQDFIISITVDPFAAGISRFRIPTDNVFTQSQNHQQAGDLFLSTEAFRRGVGVLPPPFSMGLNNNALGVNQSKHYPNEFGLLPVADPGVMVVPGTNLDQVNGVMRLSDFTPPRLYFTLAGSSPSHASLPGPDSGATIFFDPDFQQGGNEQVFAGPSQLGLVPPDEIDGLIVLDDNLNGFYDGTDTVYFTLSPNSPTLDTLGLTPGDVLASTNGVISLFAEFDILGLAHDDNVTGLDLLPLYKDSAEKTINQFVHCPSDFNGDGDVNTIDVLDFLNAWTIHDPSADFNHDGVVNTLDVLAFLNAWVRGC
ncbi:MAG: hypothetical protein IPJ41_16550 [Phycisphaerales bacterium]|nr:hypothetical protein [Phycisphaerales bacterium]